MATDSLAFVFPGQGSQYVGMGKELCREFATARETFAEADDALGFALSEICFNGPEADLKRTENTQPAILTASIAALRVIESETALHPTWLAGHSLGEYSALVGAGALTFRDAVVVVRERGRLMQQAVPEGSGAMAVILGLESQAVSKLCQDAAENEVVAPANLNGAGQVVIAGSTAAVARAAALAKQRGAKRVLDVPVSAPFHCRLMEPAAEALKKVLWDIPVRPLRTGIITNVEADVNLDAERVKPLLIQQAVSPVRWEESVQKLAALGCRRVIEIGPGKVLAGLVKRIAPDLAVDNFDVPQDVRKVRHAT